MRRILLAGLLALAAAMPALAQSNLRIGLRQDPDILDPTLGSSYVGRIVYAAMCDKLFDIDTNLAIIPQLATGYHYDDPTHLVITLRPGVKLHDGTEMTAEVAKYSLMRALTMKGSMRVGEINTIDSIDITGPLTIRLNLKAPAAQLLAQLTDRSGIVVSPKAADAAGDKFGLAPVCAGPYAFDSRVAQDRIVLKRFPGHWNAGAFSFDQVTYFSITNSSVQLANLQAGSLDLVEYLPPTDVATVQKDPKLKLAISDGLSYTGININVNNGPAAQTLIGQNALIRQAFELAIDRKALVDVVYNGMFTPTAQANPPSSPYYIAGIQPPARDIAKAKALLAQAGVSGRVPVELTITNEPGPLQSGEVLQSMVAEAGFDLKLKTMEFASSLSAGYKGEFNAYMIGWSGRVDPDGNMWALMHSKGVFNYGKHSNPEMDSLLDQARSVTDVAGRKAIYAKVWDIQRRDLPLIYLFTGKNIVAMKAGLSGFQQVPDGLIRLGGMKLGN
jgi:peptide/nickel transport system substrate-binding protein